MDDIVESEFRSIESGQRKFTFSLWACFKGFYYLTFAKFLNPDAHALAWKVVAKLNQEPERTKAWTSGSAMSSPTTTVSAPES